jgi:CTP:phosphocholine cytidylyltransferase-like protein
MKTYIVTVDDYGTKRWYLNEKLHRTDGPAIERTSGTKEWYLNGERHREDGPAIEYADGSKYWFLNGVEYTEADWLKQTQKVKAPCVGKVVEIDGVKYKLVEV